MTNKKINLSIFIIFAIILVALIIYLLLPIACPKGVAIDKLKGGSIDTVIVTDTSGSMDNITNAGNGKKMTKYQAAKEASLEIISMIDHESKTSKLNNNIGYIEFHGGVSGSYELSSSSDKITSYLKADYRGMSFGTNMGSGIEEALNLFKKSKNSNKVMIILSDGRSNTGLSNEEILSDLLPKAKKSGIKIYTVGFDAEPADMTAESQGVDPVFLYQIAKKTEGKYYYANKLLDLTYAFSDLYHQATGEVIASIKGSVEKQKSKIAKVNVPCDCGILRATLNSASASKLKVNLINPSNKVVSDSSRLEVISEKGFINISYRNPQPGEWKIQIVGDDEKAGSTDFYLSASVAKSSGAGNNLGDWIAGRLPFIVAILSTLAIMVCALINLWLINLRAKMG